MRILIMLKLIKLDNSMCPFCKSNEGLAIFILQICGESKPLTFNLPTEHWTSLVATRNLYK